MTYEGIGFVLFAVPAMIFLPPLLARTGIPVSIGLLRAAVALRLVGALTRYAVLYLLYNGVGDAVGYYGAGYRMAYRVWAGDLTLFTYEQWFGVEGGLGTDFLRNFSGIVVSLVGPSMPATYLAYSLMSFLGLFAIVLAIWRACGDEQVTRAASLIWLWPSLFFWPASIGKEAFMTFAIGIAVLGYVGRDGRVSWKMLVTGVALAFCVRAPVAGAMVMAVGIAHIVPSWKQHSGFRKGFEVIAILLLVTVTLYATRGALGLEGADLEGIQEYADAQAGKTLQGGSSIGSMPSGPLLPIQVFVNVWMRPFLWEANHVLYLFAGAEMIALWALAWHRRAGLKSLVTEWRHDRFFRLAVPLWAGLTLMLGLALGNLGIIARQRSLALPFLLAAVAFVPAAAAEATERTAESPHDSDRRGRRDRRTPRHTRRLRPASVLSRRLEARTPRTT